MQGTCLAPLKCTTTMSQMGAMAYRTGNPLLTYKDTVKIPSLGMIDDIASINKCGIDSVISNSVTNAFIESKRLELGENKSHRIHIGCKNNKKEKSCPKLKVHNNIIKDSSEEKYVGDLI